MKRIDYVTSTTRASASLVLGVGVGGVLSLLQIIALAAAEPNRMNDLISSTRTTGLELILRASLTWEGLTYFLVAVFIVVPISFWILHCHGARQAIHGLVLGATLGLAVFVSIVLWNPAWQALGLISYLSKDFGGITVLDGILTNDGWAAAITGGIGMTISGAVGGAIAWTIAFRRQPVGQL